MRVSSISAWAIMALQAVNGHAAVWERLPYYSASHVIDSDQTGGIKKIESTTVENVQNLLESGEDAVVKKGNSSLILQLGGQVGINGILFSSSDCEGTVQCYASTDRQSWAPLGKKVVTKNMAYVELTFAMFQGKYIRLDFSLTSPGKIRSLAIIGPESEGDSRLFYSAPHPIYAYPTPVNLGTPSFFHDVYNFPPSREKVLTVIVDYNVPRSVKEVKLSGYTAKSLKLEVFAFDKLPEKHNWRGRRVFDPETFAKLEPIANAEDTTGRGSLTAKPKAPEDAIYVALRFHVNFTDSKTARAGHSDSPAEIFGKLIRAVEAAYDGTARFIQAEAGGGFSVTASVTTGPPTGGGGGGSSSSNNSSKTKGGSGSGNGSNNNGQSNGGNASTAPAYSAPPPPAPPPSSGGLGSPGNQPAGNNPPPANNNGNGPVIVIPPVNPTTP